MVYALRVVIHESQWERQLRDIVWLCKEAHIEEVYLKEQCHQMLMSPFPLQKHRRMAEIYQKIKHKLSEENIRCGVNIASLVGHVDCKLDEAELVAEEKFVGDSLRTSDSNYCILGESWRQYACETAAIYAHIHPHILWIDDDFRSLNHTEQFGCFCPLHAKAVSEALGLTLTSRALREALVRDDDFGLKVRRAWIKINYAGQKLAAARLEAAVHAVDAQVRIGLMNSGEPAHALQGRDMDELLKTFAGKNRPVSRPLGGAYQDCLHQELLAIHQGMALSIACLSEDVEIVSEVENWPHTRYTKSVFMTQLQMKLHTLVGADKLSLNVFDFMGTPYAQEPELIAMLEKTKPELARIQQARQGKKLAGVGLLWYDGQVERLPMKTGQLSDLMLQRPLDTLLPMLGIPTCFEETQVNVLAGVNARCCGREKLLSLLSGGLLIDAETAAYLCSLGLQAYIGCQSSGNFVECPSAEKLLPSKLNGEFAGNLLPTDWVRLHYENERIPLFSYAEECQILSVFVDQEHRYLGDGIALYENSLGGRICVIPGHIGTWQFAYKSRSFQLRAIVRWLYRDKEAFSLKAGVNVAPFYYEGEDGGLLALLNTGLDSQRVSIASKHSIRAFDGVECSDSMELKPLELRLLYLSAAKIWKS